MNMRIPLFALDHKHVVKGATLDDLMEVLAWSFTCLALGKYPVARHDNSPFNSSGRSRLKQAGSSINLHGILVECRGDWKQLKDVFRFPQIQRKCRHMLAMHLHSANVEARWRGSPLAP